jgi:RNA polymerase sigma factor (TIGR02999 family)
MSSPAQDRPVTQLLLQWRAGSQEALDELMPMVYSQLRVLASRLMSSERPGHTMRATALVNEAYLRLVDAEVTWQDRAHFFALSARLMRRILVDHAKANNRQKRGAGAARVTLDEGIMVSAGREAGLMELDEALHKLAEFDQRKAELIELLYFGGLTYEEAAEVLKISPATVHRELKMAKAWLFNELKASQPAAD